MYNVTAAWAASPPGAGLGPVSNYNVQWVRNGANAAIVSVPQSASADAAGYSTDFVSGNPGVTLAPGDTVQAIVTADDAADHLDSSPTPSQIGTIPTPPPPALLPPNPVASVALTVTGP